MTSARLFSIGHSNHDLARLLDLLRGAGVTAVADVRSRPFSRYLPHFNRPQLERALRAADLGYAFLGDSLGGRPADTSVYDGEGQVDYERVRATAWFGRGLDRLLRGAEGYVIAMLCAEEDPLDCHRGLMIGPALVERGQPPCHIRGTGLIETTESLEQRLMEETGVGAGILDGLFAHTVDGPERARLVSEAYREQARRKAFRLSTPE